MDSINAISITQTVGGLGLFLLGMIVMTDGLGILAGSSIRSVLQRFTRSPLSGVMTGAGSTALLQSSSATTVAAVGFVGAGLMSFQSALGIIIGANLGTTITGWLVVLVGFKLDLMALMFPCVFLGMLLKLLTSGRVAAVGLAVAGFGTIFIGIEQMQLGMSSMQGILSEFDPRTDTVAGRLVLVLAGAAFTALTQSSSAGVAAVLTAMYSEAITLAQGLALVIGMDIGTTVTAMMATVGGSASSRRTGYSHFVYNVMTAVMAFMLITPYVEFWKTIGTEQLAQNSQTILVAFHSGFNLLGVILVLPFAQQFARLMLRVVPESESGYTSRLDSSLLKEPALALDALCASVEAAFLALLEHIDAILSAENSMNHADLRSLQLALDETHDYADDIHLDSDRVRRPKLVNCFHVLDHLQRLHERCDEDAPSQRQLRHATDLTLDHLRLKQTVERVAQSLQEGRYDEARDLARKNSEAFSDRIETVRASILSHVADVSLEVEEATSALKVMRWFTRVSNHIAQITLHLAEIHDHEAARAEKKTRA